MLDLEEVTSLLADKCPQLHADSLRSDKAVRVGYGFTRWSGTADQEMDSPGGLVCTGRVKWFLGKESCCHQSDTGFSEGEKYLPLLCTNTWGRQSQEILLESTSGSMSPHSSCHTALRPCQPNAVVGEEEGVVEREREEGGRVAGREGERGTLSLAHSLPENCTILLGVFLRCATAFWQHFRVILSNMLAVSHE